MSLDGVIGCIAITQPSSSPDDCNGLPPRRDIHRPLDLGFVTVGPDRRFAVDPALRDELPEMARRHRPPRAGRSLLVRYLHRRRAQLRRPEARDR